MTRKFSYNLAILWIIGLAELFVPLETGKWGYLRLFLKYNYPPNFPISSGKLGGGTPAKYVVLLKVALHGDLEQSPDTTGNIIIHSIPYHNSSGRDLESDLRSVEINMLKFTREWPVTFKARCEVVKDGLSPITEYIRDINNVQVISSIFEPVLVQTFDLSFPGGCSWNFELSTNCDDDWYGISCNIYCRADLQRVFACFPDGSKQCRMGFTGPDCTDDINECELVSNLCDNFKNNSICHNIIGSFRCVCPLGFVKTQTGCLGVNECELSRNRICVRGVCKNTAESYLCVCPPQYTGKNCEEDVDECALENFCKNGATCYNSFGSFKCVCPRYSFGIQCEMVVDPCRDLHCGDNGICQGFGNKWNCTCDDGFSGPDCGERDVSRQCLEKNPCKNGGQCHFDRSTASIKCYCPLLYKGKFCDQKNRDALLEMRSNSHRLNFGDAEKGNAVQIATLRTLFAAILVVSAGAVLSVIYSKVRKTSVEDSSTTNPSRNSVEIDAP